MGFPHETLNHDAVIIVPSLPQGKVARNKVEEDQQASKAYFGAKSIHFFPAVEKWIQQ